MAKVIEFGPGGYRYLEGVFQYSAGVAAQPGFAIERARFRTPVPLLDGFAAVEAHLEAAGRPMTAFCACELRSPEPFSETGFVDFNRQYVKTLERWGIFKNDINPVARTNVCPVLDAPAEPSLYAFSYTVPSSATNGGFIVAGSGEAREGGGPYSQSIVRYGETSPDAIVDKIRQVMTTMESRLLALGSGWADAGAVNVYTVHDIGAVAGDEIWWGAADSDAE